MKKVYAIITCLISLFTSCGVNEMPETFEKTGGSLNQSGTKSESQPIAASSDFVRGADISWLTEMEDKGYKFYYADGRNGDCMEILKGLGMNTFRLRVWVNPTNKYNGLDDVMAKVRRASALGMDLMIDFHYSDTWADPSAQSVPKDWAGLDIDGLVGKVGEYTESVLRTIKAEGIDVKWVQVGNETGNGMLFPYGKADVNPKGYARLNNAGYDAVKSVYPEAKVIVHLQEGQNNSLFRWLFDLLKKNGGKWDVIGMSLYPERTDYVSMVNQCRSNMLDMVSRFDTDVMLCEVGMGNSYETECRAFLDLCFKLKEEIPGDRYRGLLYWEPQCYNSFNGYRKGAFTDEGRPSSALEAYKSSDSSVPVVTVD